LEQQQKKGNHHSSLKLNLDIINLYERHRRNKMKRTSVRCVNHQWNPLSILMVLMLIASVMCISKAFAQPLDSEVPPSSSNEVVADYSEDQPWVLKDKRPFCNAFAGMFYLLKKWNYSFL